jgi:hypothetical protein
MGIQTYDEFYDYLWREKFFKQTSSRGRVTFVKTYDDVHAQKYFPTLVNVTVDIFFSGEDNSSNEKKQFEEEVYLVVWRVFYEQESAKYNIFETCEKLQELDQKVQKLNKEYQRFPFPE